MTVFYLAQGQKASGGLDQILGFLFPFIMMAAIMYFLMNRPQRKKEKERKALLDRIKKDDHVVTIGGVHGVVMSVSEESVVLRVDDEKNIRIKFARSAISRVEENTSKN